MQTLFLQVNELSQDLYWLAGAAVLLVIAAVYFRKILADRKEREAIAHDPRSHVVNDSNYNKNREGIDGHRSEGLNTAEAREGIENFTETDEIPTDAEFHDLRKNIKKT